MSDCNVIKGTKIVLREKKIDDAEQDYAWRRDPELAQLDATTPLDMPYPEYLMYYAEELNYANARGHRYAIEDLEGNHIGNCTYYNLNADKREAELGILIGERDCWNKGYGTDAVIALVSVGFEEINLNRIYLHTLEWNIRAQKCFEKCGFVPCGQINRGGYNFVMMEMKKTNYQDQNHKEYPGSV